MTKIALLGRPNVGKSSLFNRLIKQRLAITSDTSGTTRDVKTNNFFIDEKEFLLSDTGGLDEVDELFKNIQKNSLQAANEADILLYMVDGKTLPNEDDRKIIYSLLKLKKPIALLVNKIDNDKMLQNFWEFSEFGIEKTFAISVSHNRGVEDLKEWLLKFYSNKLEIKNDDDDFLEDFLSDEENIKDINIAILGKVNVGKSSLLNALSGKNRSVVSDVAGTTIDPVDESFYHEGYNFNFIDTAGIRRRGKIEGIEKFALNRTIKMLENANLALLVLDSSQNFSELDERIASYILKNNLSCIIVLNKWDKSIFEFQEAIKEIRYKFKFLSYAPIITISALSKLRLHKLKSLVIEVFENYKRRIPTARLNEVIKIATSKHQIPSDKGKLVKIYYATQFDIMPPKIALVCNRPKTLHFSYLRYLKNELREEIKLDGVPIVLIPKNKNKEEK